MNLKSEHQIPDTGSIINSVSFSQIWLLQTFFPLCFLSILLYTDGIVYRDYLDLYGF